MGKKLSVLCILLLALLPKAQASHIYGGELLYQHITGNTYRVILVLYGDCGSTNQQVLQSLNAAAPQVQVLNASPTPIATLYLPIDTAQSDKEVTPVCPKDAGSTQCVDPSFPIPGIKQYVYHDTITLPYTSATWGFVFTGNLGTQVSAGRTGSITNISFAQGYSTIYLIARLNNLNGPNSSPVYTTIPTPFYCLNVLQQYNHGATDPDNDSLAFAMVPGLNSGSAINYIPPYTAQKPLSADSFQFNTLNGQLTFKPNLLQRPLVVNEVKEYKNGVMVGSSMREMSFIVLDNCQNKPPNGDIKDYGSNIVGGVHDGNNVINVCSGTPQVGFNLAPADPDNADSVTLTTYNVPPGANITISNNGTPQPLLQFSWNTTGVAPGIYSFYINYKDNGCPLSSNQTVAYTIQVANPYTVYTEVLSPTNCYHRAGVRYHLSGGIKPRRVQVSQNNSIIRNFTDTTGVINDSLASGTYTLRVFSEFFSCDTSITFTIADSGKYPIPPTGSSNQYCRGDASTPPAVAPVDGATLTWYDEQGNQVPGAPSINTSVPGTYTWYANQTVNVCTSDTAVIRVIVYDRPDVNIRNNSGKVCLADWIYLEATGARSYTWLPVGNIHETRDGKPYGIVTEPVTYTVVGVDENGCSDSASITYADIEKCCNFAYPNAFTPNGDGKNDRFRPILYGNMEEYEISIYNRFGERVYHSKDAKSGWNGTYNGRPCDVGMYYFYVKAKCFTGQYEEKADAVNLLK
ncbi:MAG: gliding motility-associated C-terminal domain-containing protein [Flavipsychrobacter sp.]|nr:gliding motility-associated C-terminal domain-containing protein [Flavipsychrobacter sp.]